MSGDYAQFLAAKAARPRFDSCPRAGELHEGLFEHQRALVDWALRRGRAAIFADTGLGKTFMEVEWARHVATAGPVLMLAPLAVAEQTMREAAQRGVRVQYVRRPEAIESNIVITNYDLLEHFAAREWAGVVLDESSILKAYDGKTRNAIIGAFGRTPYRLACTATPAPNDFTELGNHSEFLGVKSRAEMLAEYFCHDGGNTSVWRLKGHAEAAFWRWVCSWGAAMKLPSDIGFSDEGFILPALEMHEHVIPVDHREAHAVADSRGQHYLFAPHVKTLSDQRATRRMTQGKRVELAAELCACDEPVLVWCELNAEADAITEAVPDAVQLAGDDDHRRKVDRLVGFSEGRYRVLVTKPSIAGFGLNWQHCAKMVFVGASHSYEQTYQAIRRCWRFGQRRPVHVHVIRAETESAIIANFRRKEADAERLSRQMVEFMREGMALDVGAARRETNAYAPATTMRVPGWIGKEEAA
jgi:superfamily II DNA or RNA helicase